MRRNTKKIGAFSDFEKEAMKARAKELALEEKLSKNKALGENDVMTAIAKMSEPDRSMATRIHVIIKKNAPTLLPRTWYGMPAYAKDDKVVCFFQNAGKFKARYSTLGFNDAAKLDEGSMWPTSFAITKLSSIEESKIVTLIKKAVND